MLIREMKLGDSASVTKTVTETDVYLFAGITGDLNPPTPTRFPPARPSSAAGLPTASWGPVLSPQCWA